MASLAGNVDMLKYNAVARAFHWAIAALVIFNLASGIGGEAIEDVWNVFPTHKATGILILLLTLGRIGWRLTWTMPAWPETMSAMKRAVARTTHFGLYALMLAVPLTGWTMSSAGKYPISMFGLFEWPKFALTKDSPLAKAAHEGHEILGFLMAGLVVLHIAAALHHHFVRKDISLRRMF